LFDPCWVYPGTVGRGPPGEARWCVRRAGRAHERL